MHVSAQAALRLSREWLIKSVMVLLDPNTLTRISLVILELIRDNHELRLRGRSAFIS